MTGLRTNWVKTPPTKTNFRMQDWRRILLWAVMASAAAGVLLGVLNAVFGWSLSH
jgi:hypothetical protein